MKNIILLSLVFISLIGCDMSYNSLTIYNEMISDHTLFYDASFSSISNEGCIGSWLAVNMDYVKDSEDSGKWIDPSISFYRGYDDCTGFTLVYLNIAYMEYGVKNSLIFVNQLDLSDTNPKNFNHVMIVENGYIADGQGGMRHARLENVRPNGEYVFSFDEVFTY